MSRLPVIEGQVRCPRERREVDCERCYVCDRLAAEPDPSGAILCEEGAGGHPWLRAALAALFAS